MEGSEKLFYSSSDSPPIDRMINQINMHKGGDGMPKELKMEMVRGLVLHLLELKKNVNINCGCKSDIN